MQVEIASGGPLIGVLRVPGDKSISHRSLLFAALADGMSTVSGLSTGDDVRRTRLAMEAMGVQITESIVGSEPVLNIRGGDGLREPDDVIDMGNAGTGIRLLAGWCAAFPWLTVLTGDASLRSRPMWRVVEPLRRMGAQVDGRHGGERAPLSIRGGELQGIEFTPVPGTAQYKSAVLIAGLRARGKTVIHESQPARMHTEEMFAAYGADISTEEHADGSCKTTLRPSVLKPFTLEVPGDPSQAAFWMVAASVVPDSDLTIENVYLGPGRGGIVDVLLRMGADIDVSHHDGTSADIRVRHSALRGTDVCGDEIPSMIDELPVLAVAAAMASGRTTIADAGELRVKESDRISAVVSQLGALGARIEERPDGYVVDGTPGTQLAGGHMQAHLDHRIAMTGAIAALVSTKPVTIEGWDSVETSYPTFLDDLAKLRTTSEYS